MIAVLVSKTPILVAHLLGLCLSIGPVFLIDIRMLRVLRGGPILQAEIDLIAVLSPWIRLGLVLLWVSGAGFLVHYALHTPEALANPKLHAKLLIVAILTVNSVLVEGYLFRQLHERLGQPLFAPGETRQHLAILAIAATSATGWYAALVLGAARELNFACAAWMILAGGGLAGLAVFGALWTLHRFSLPSRSRLAPGQVEGAPNAGSPQVGFGGVSS